MKNKFLIKNLRINKRGDIPIMILVIGVVLLCGIALLNFYLYGNESKQDISPIFNLQEIYNLATSAKFSGDDLIANYGNIRKEGDSFIAEKKYFKGNEILMEIKYTLP